MNKAEFLERYTDTVNCCDCLNFMRQMPDGCVNLVVTSPPYNIKKDYKGYKDDKPWAEFVDWFQVVFSESWRVSGGNIVMVIGTHNNLQFYTKIRGLACLAQNCKLIYMPTWSIVNPIELAVYCYKDNSGWSKKHIMPLVCNGTIATYIPTMVGKADTEKLHPNHPCSFPIRFPRIFINGLTNKGDTIFDPFLGSGTTAVAAWEFRRHYIGCEISKQYVDIANKRIEAEKEKYKLFPE